MKSQWKRNADARKKSKQMKVTYIVFDHMHYLTDNDFLNFKFYLISFLSSWTWQYRVIVNAESDRNNEKPEPEKADAKKPDPEKADAKKPEPEKADANQPDPEKADAKKPEPVKPDPKELDPQPHPTEISGYGWLPVHY